MTEYIDFRSNVAITLLVVDWQISQFNWESLCDIRPDCHHHFDANGTSNAMFDELAERPLMTHLVGTKHAYVRLAIVIFSHF